MRQETKSMKTKSESLLRVLFTLLSLFLLLTFIPLSFAHEGHDHGEEEKKSAPVNANAQTAIFTAERNVKTNEGQFNVRLQRTPADPRTGELTQMHVRFAERVEGGFGDETEPLENPNIAISLTTADGKTIAQNIKAESEGKGVYHVAYSFQNSGDYKIAFTVNTKDNRQFAVDFPVNVTTAPTNWAFWFGLVALILVIGGGFASLLMFLFKGQKTIGQRAKFAVPVGAVLLLIFTLATLTLAYFQPPRQKREIAALPEMNEQSFEAAAGDNSLVGSGAKITVPKESQLLFKISTQPIGEREIIGGLKVTGVVKAKPDAKAIISPPVSGRVFLRQGLTVGSAVGRGEQIGTVEQVLGAPEQANLEAQRVALRTAALEQQAKKAEHEALAQQARTRLTQAQRELKRAQNLYDVGAAPKKRVEEAETVVKLTEQELVSAEKQARSAAEQARLAQEAVNRVAPVRSFSLTSPVTGLISEMKITSGQNAEAGTELFSVVNLSSVFLEAQVFERNLDSVRESTRASYTAAGIPNEVFRIGDGEGQRLMIGQTVHPETRTVSVIYEVKNPMNKLRDGMFVEITVDITGKASVLSVPKSAVINEQGRTFVFVFLGGESFEKRAVVLGTEGQDFYEVKTGLKANERVVTEGVYQLRSVKTE